MRPIKDGYNIPLEYYNYDVMSLLELEEKKKRNITGKLLKCLKKSNINTIGELIHLSEYDLLVVDGVGKKSLNRLYCVLKLAETQEIMNLEKPKDHIDKLKQRYIKRTKNK